MVRLLGLNIPDNLNIKYALTTFYGIGLSTSIKILKECNISTSKSIKELSDDELKRIISVVDKNYKIEGDLREIIVENIKRLKDINAYRGSRHMKGLPARGQRTRSNARTKRGKRKTVGALKKEVWAQQQQGDKTES